MCIFSLFILFFKYLYIMNESRIFIAWIQAFSGVNVIFPFVKPNHSVSQMLRCKQSLRQRLWSIVENILNMLYHWFCFSWFNISCKEWKGWWFDIETGQKWNKSTKSKKCNNLQHNILRRSLTASEDRTSGDDQLQCEVEVRVHHSKAMFCLAALENNNT